MGNGSFLYYYNNDIVHFQSRMSEGNRSNVNSLKQQANIGSDIGLPPERHEAGTNVELFRL